MANTGQQGYNTLEQYYIDNNQPTGITKPNSVGDPNYIAPTLNINSCPIITYSATRSGTFTKQCTSPSTGSTLPYSKVYVSTVSQADAQTQANNDTANFNTLGQNYVNSLGTCTAPTYIWGNITNEQIVTVNTVQYAYIVLRTYQGTSATVAPSPVPANVYPCTNGSIAISYHQVGTYPGSPNNFAVSMNNATQLQLVAPNTSTSNPVYPKEAILLPDGTYFYMAFTNAVNGQMVLLQTVYQ